jgi:hypothetical protein
MLFFIWLSIFIFISFVIAIIYSPQCGIIFDACDKGIIDVKSNSRNLYSRCRGRLCWNTVEEQVEIDSTRMFIMYVHV